MRIKRPKFSSMTFLCTALILLIIIICIPLTWCFEDFRHIAQLLSIVFFITGMLLIRRKYVIIGLTITILNIVFSINVYGLDFFSICFNNCTGWAFIMIGIFLTKNGEERFCRRALYLILAIYIAISFSTILGLQKYPMAVRELGRGISYSPGMSNFEFELVKQHYRALNIASLSQLYGIVFAIPCFLYAYAKSKNLLFVAGAIICEICVLKAQVTFALLLSFALIMLCIMKPSNRRKSLIIFGSMFFFGAFILLSIKPILLIAVNIFVNKNMMAISDKLLSLYNLLNGKATGDALDRIVLYRRSVDVFFKHPLIGQSINGVDSANIFSGHSEFLDKLGYYGIFGLVIFLILIFQYIKFVRNSCGFKWLHLVLLFGFLALYTFNVMWTLPQVYLGTFVMPVLVSRAFGNKQKRLNGKDSPLRSRRLK